MRTTLHAKIGISFEPRDIWVGVFWTKTLFDIRIFVCIVPCIPIYLAFWRTEEVV